MSRRLPRRISIAICSLALALGMPVLAEDTAQEGARPQLALMGTVPIYWGEADGLDELVQGQADPHWAREVLERHFELQPLDFLTGEALAGQRFLLMAQPRALAPTENVALDEWVRSGGSLLLFADPMMTGESRFSIGDRRRPHDVALLSPILSHWGLELQFDESQERGFRSFDVFNEPVPVNLVGRLVTKAEDDSPECFPRETGEIAVCLPDKGIVLIIADAAILDHAGPHPHAEVALDHLLQAAFAGVGENAGIDGSWRPAEPEIDEIEPYSVQAATQLNTAQSP